MSQAQTAQPAPTADPEPAPQQMPQQPSEDFMRLMAKDVTVDMRAIVAGKDTQFKTYDGRTIMLNVKMLGVIMSEAFKFATREEKATFVHYCATNRLDPFRKQVYFIKYKADAPPAFVTSWEVVLDRANRHPQFDGFESGVVWRVQQGDSVTALRGKPCDFSEDAEHQIIGGWATIHRKDRKVPRDVEVPLSEMQATRWDSATRQRVPTRAWAEMKTTMCTKTPAARGLRQCFPDILQGLVIEEEGGSVEKVLGAPLGSVAMSLGAKKKPNDDGAPTEAPPADPEPAESDPPAPKAQGRRRRFRP